LAPSYCPPPVGGGRAAWGGREGSDGSERLQPLTPSASSVGTSP
jgi:hypothetical protein